MKNIFIFCSLYLFAFPILGQTADDRANTPVPFTLADRDRLIKLEVQVQALNDKIDTEIGSVRNEMRSEIGALRSEIASVRREMNSLSREIDSQRSLLYIMIAGIFGLIGFTVWDRRTFHLKLEKRVEALEKRPIVYSPK